MCLYGTCLRLCIRGCVHKCDLIMSVLCGAHAETNRICVCMLGVCAWGPVSSPATECGGGGGGGGPTVTTHNASHTPTQPTFLASQPASTPSQHQHNERSCILCVTILLFKTFTTSATCITFTKHGQQYHDHYTWLQHLLLPASDIY